MKKYNFIKVVNGVAETSIHKKGNLLRLTDQEAKVFNEAHDPKEMELIKVKINLERIK